MTPKRLIAGTLSFLLWVLLGWSVFAGIGDLKTRIILAAGGALGSLYSVLGRLPDGIVENSGGFITDDDDPSNISPVVYLPIVLGAILIAVIASCVALF